MKKNIADTSKTAIGLIVLIVAVRQIPSFPWWTFVIPAFVWGMFAAFRKWDVRGFPIGFLIGLGIWVVASLFFDARSGGIAMSRIALLFAIPKWLLIGISGVIGGLLTGLSLYTGKGLFSSTKQVYEK